MSFRGRPKAESRNLFDSALGLSQDKPVRWAGTRSRQCPQIPPLGPNGPERRDDRVGVASLPQREDTQKCHSEGGQGPIRGIHSTRPSASLRTSLWSGQWRAHGMAHRSLRSGPMGPRSG